MSSEPPPGGGTAAGGAAKSPPPPTEWVEIIEPRSGEHMYANLTSGECVWDPPVGVAVKKTNDNQWWELFDQNTSRFYYYNATSQTTVWHRPADCDIIPLAKLQTLKQNTEVKTSTSEAAGILSKPNSDVDENSVSETTLSPGKRRLKKQVQKHRRKVSETQTENTGQPPLARFLPGTSSTASTDQAAILASSYAQTSPLASPRLSAARRRSHRHYHSRPKFEPDTDVNNTGSLSSVNVPSASNSLRVTSSQTRSPPNRLGLSKQLSLEGETFKKQVISRLPSQPPSLQPINSEHPLQQQSSSHQPSIARSVSFMSKTRPAVYDNYAPIGWRSSGRSSVESTPSTSRRSATGTTSGASNGLNNQEITGGNSQHHHNATITSPVEGYCTPLTHRRTSIDNNKSSQRLNKSNTSTISTASSKNGNNGNGNSSGNSGGTTKNSTSNQKPLAPSQPLSISELVDSGLTALGEAKLSKTRNGGGGQATTTTTTTSSATTTATSTNPKMSPLQAYILEQAKLSGYDVADDRDSYVESDLDSRHGAASDSDEFADDEDGGCSDNISKTSSSVDDEYLNVEPMYNNLEAMWSQEMQQQLQQQHQPKKAPPPPMQPPPPPAKRTAAVDAFSEEFDLRMKLDRGGGSSNTTRSFNNNNNSQRSAGGHHYTNNSSTMPRPTSIQPHHQRGVGLHQGSAQGPGGADHPAAQGQGQNFPVPYDVLHPSLQRNAHSLMVDPLALQKANQSLLHQAGGLGGLGQHGRGMNQSSLSVTASMEADIEKYAQDNFNVQKRGLFRKRLSIKAILTWTTEAINKPLTSLPTDEKAAKKEAVLAFRLIQIYMGDRKAKPGMTINSVALDITNMGYNKPSLRDEIFVQLCKQTTDNPKKDSLRRGWELMAICLAFFPPSATFGPFLQGYIAKHRDPSLDEFPDAHKWPIHIQISHYAGICAKRLERIGDGGRLKPRKPSLDDIDQSRLLIFRPSMFGGTLIETLDVQRERFPHLRLPWILTTMADQILRLNGTGTEGIFRVPADLEEVQSLKSRFDQWEVVLCRDCHTAASLLKMWLRDLYEPLIPDAFYDECIALAVNLDKDSVNKPEKAKRLAAFVTRLPELNALVLMYLVRFLQLFAQTSVSLVTKMDDSNLATVFAPNVLRCPSTDPMVIMENTRKEMTFVKHLIQCLETSVAEGIL